MKQINDLTGDQTQDTKMSCPDGLTRTCSGVQQVVTSIAWVQLAGVGGGGGGGFARIVSKLIVYMH